MNRKALFAESDYTAWRDGVVDARVSLSRRKSYPCVVVWYIHPETRGIRLLYVYRDDFDCDPNSEPAHA